MLLIGIARATEILSWIPLRRFVPPGLLRHRDDPGSDSPPTLSISRLSWLGDKSASGRALPMQRSSPAHAACLTIK